VPIPAQVIMQFVGLCMFSNQVPNDDGLKVILPQVVYHDPRIVTERMSMATAHHIGEPVVSVPNGPQRHVEDHIAIMAFKMSSYMTHVNWAAPTPLPGDPTYGYVKLDGDRLRIETGLPDPKVGILGDLKLPPLKTLCPLMATLAPGFQPPYAGAAAVFDLPQGTVNSCSAGLRVDTEVKLDVGGTFVISASTMRSRKEIRFRGNGVVELIVANIPTSCLSAAGCTPVDPSSIAGVSHAHAYYAMGTQSASCNASVQAWFNSATAAEKPAAPCVMTIPAAAGGSGMAEVGKLAAPSSTQATNFECSNTKWP
jgi:hypothetical protein